MLQAHIIVEVVNSNVAGILGLQFVIFCLRYCFLVYVTFWSFFGNLLGEIKLI